MMCEHGNKNKHQFESMVEMVKSLSNDELIEICNEIYDWHNNELGILKQDGKLNGIYNEFEGDWWLHNIKNIVLIEAHARFSKVVKVLFVENPSLYVK